MGLLKGRCDDFVDLAAGAEDIVAGAEGAEVEGPKIGADGPTSATDAGGGECIITTGAGVDGWGKASLFTDC